MPRVGDGGGPLKRREAGATLWGGRVGSRLVGPWQSGRLHRNPPSTHREPPRGDRGSLRVDLNPQSSRIVVIRDAGDGRRSEALEILSGQGGGAVIDLVSDLASCRARCASVAVDLLVLETGLRPMPSEPIEELASIGPPLVVLLREEDAAETLEATRRGASDG